MTSQVPVHVSYATANYSQAAKLLVKTARKFGLMDTRIYTPQHPAVRELARNHPTIMSAKRGAGYWLWKPFIVLDAMNSVPDGTPILYSDIAMTFIADPAPLVSLADRHPICLFTTEGQPQSTWTKRDCFVELGADTSEFWSLNQLWAGFQLYRTGPEAREFLHSLAEAMTNEAALSDAPNKCGLPNLPDFRDHRHDQSILTILAHRHGAAVFADPSQYGPWPMDDALFPQTVHLHRRRNHHPLKAIWDRVRQSYNGRRGFI